MCRTACRTACRIVSPVGTVHGDLGPFVAGLPFSLSAYQAEALAALEAPETSVVVVAPTGSGKSVIADAAIGQALTRGATAAYSSPLRAPEILETMAKGNCRSICSASAPVDIASGSA